MFIRNCFSLFSGMLISCISIAQCTSNFSFTAVSDTLQFTNLSVAQNAHYYWNFGDGSTSYETSPLHVFPESGKYIISLYLLDTISGCHTAKDSLLTVVRQNAGSCQPDLAYYYTTGPMYDLLHVNDLSQNCNNYTAYMNAGPAMNFQPNSSVYIDSGWMPANFIGSIRYVTSDSINGYSVKRACYATMPYHYRSSENYDSCTANFEFSVSYQPNGALLNFHSMNTSQSSYDFVILGLGNPVHLYSDNASYLMPYINYNEYMPWLIGSYSTGTSGCRDSCWQQVLIKNLTYVEPPTCEIHSQPQDQVVEEGNTAMIISATDQETSRQWQRDDGTGYINLTNAGQYSGVNTDTLMISNVTMSMNNYRYRCIVSSSQSHCHNTSDVSTLYVERANISLYPVPAHNTLNIIFTDNRYVSGVTIYNALGQKVFETEIAGQSGTIDLYTFDPGIYTIEVITNGERSRAKFVKE